MEELVFQGLASKLDYHVVIQIAVHKLKAKMTHSIDQGKLVRTRCIVNFAFNTLNNFILGNHCVTDA